MTTLYLSGPKHFLIKVNECVFCFSIRKKESQNSSCLRSTVTFPQSVMIQGVVPFVCVDSQLFTKKYWRSLCFSLLTISTEMLILFSRRTLCVINVLGMISLMSITVLDWVVNLADINPMDDLWDIVNIFCSTIHI